MKASAEPAPPGGRLKLTSEGLAWLAAAAVLGLIGWSKSLNLLLVLAYVMVALLVLNGVLAWRHANRARSRRSLPPSLFAGESAEVQTLVTNIAARRTTVLVTDREREWSAPELAAGGTAAFTANERFGTRGRVTLPPLVTVSGFPFGFLRYERPEPGADTVAVLPRLGNADADGLRLWLLRMAGSEGRSRKALRRVTHDHADVRGIRPYRHGDSLRAVHWKSSARRGSLMVREYDAAPSPDVVIVVEPWLPANPTDGDRENLEAALSLAATIASTWCRELGARVTLAVGGNTTHFSSEAAQREALIPLADAEGSPAPVPPDVPAFARTAARAARLIVSSRVDTPLADTLAREVGKPFATLAPQQSPFWYQPPVRT